MDLETIRNTQNKSGRSVKTLRGISSRGKHHTSYFNVQKYDVLPLK
jgi:hypothetical protein